MQRNLLLVRHAKSSSDLAGLSDFERPLNDRGLKNALQMGRRLQELNYYTGSIISSPALRAITTAELIASKINFDKSKIIKNPDIYNAGLDTLLATLAGLGDKYYSLCLVGHNPGFTYLCNYLCNAHIDNMPTCSYAQIIFNSGGWSEITKSTGKLMLFDFPENQ